MTDPVVAGDLGPAGHSISLVGDVCHDQEAHLLNLVKAFENGDQRDVVVDLSGVRILGSTGMTFLVMLARACSERVGRLVLLAPNDFVRRTLETVGFNREFAIVKE